MKKIYSIITAFILSACTIKSSTPDDYYLNHTINLFPDNKKEKTLEANEFSFEHTMKLSDYVIYTNDFFILDSFASDRGLKNIYLYKIKTGKIYKQPQKKIKSKYQLVFTSIQFLSKNKIHLKQELTDSVHIFLIKNNDFSLLKKQLDTPYSLLETHQ
jgi:hypothetical protein